MGEYPLAGYRSQLCGSGGFLGGRTSGVCTSGYVTGDEQLRKFWGTALSQLVGGLGIVFWWLKLQTSRGVMMLVTDKLRGSLWLSEVITARNVTQSIISSND